MTRDFEVQASKVPEVTLGCWMIKLLATTLGETGGDTVTMTWLKADAMVNAGYLVGSAIFLALLIVLVAAQIAAKRFRPFLYWATIAASTTFGTAMADFADRSLGIGYAGGSILLFNCLMVVLALWYWSEGTISVNTVSTPRVESFYWAAITFSQTLGTALGDWIADTGGLGYEGGASVFIAKRGGTVVTCAATSGFMIEYDNRHLWMKLKRIVSSHFANYQEAWEMNRLIDRGAIQPVMSAVYPLEQVGEAARAVHRNESEGKLGVLCLAREPGLGITDRDKRERIGEDRITLFQRHARGEL